MFQQLALIFASGNTSQINLLFAKDYLDYQKPKFTRYWRLKEFKVIVQLAGKSMLKPKVEVVDENLS